MIFLEFSGTGYLWIKAFHIISVMAWMAGMLYLPRLFVYHAEADAGSDKAETFKIMERRLLRAIMHPALIVSFLFGGILLFNLGDAVLASGWLLVKVVLVMAMLVIHGLLAKWGKDFAEDRNLHPARFFRIVNEVPTLLLVAIVILAVVKPF
jgi:putative membrane protein